MQWEMHISLFLSKYIYKYSFIIFAFIVYISFSIVYAVYIPCKHMTGTNDRQDTSHSEDYTHTSQLVLNAAVQHSHYIKLCILTLDV